MESWWLQLFMANVQCHWEAEALCRVSHKPLRYEEQGGMGMKEVSRIAAAPRHGWSQGNQRFILMLQ